MAKKIGHKSLILAIIAAAQFMVILDISIVNVALPSIFRSLHFSSANNLQWVVTAYTLAFGGFLLLGGRAADLYGRKRIFLVGVTLFSIASLLCGLSPNSGTLVVVRALQGFAAAFMSPAALSIILTTFTEGKERNKALGVWAAIAAGGAAVGVLLGGFLTEYLDWRWNFFVNVPVGLLVLYLAYRYVPESKADLSHRNLDIPGALLVTAGLMMLVYGLARAPALGWTSNTSIQFLGGSAVLLVAFIINEARAKHPLMPLGIFRVRNIGGANLVQLPIAASLFSMFFFLTLYIQTVLGYSPVKSGLCFLPVTFIIGITSGIVSSQIAKVGYKPFLIVGPILLATGLFMFSRMPVDGHYLANVFPGLAVMAVGLGCVFVSLTIAATSGVSHNDSGLASGILNTSQQVGGSLGLAILSGVATSKTAQVLASSPHTREGGLAAQVAGYHNAFLTGVSFALIALVLAVFVIHQKKGEKIDPRAALGG